MEYDPIKDFLGRFFNRRPWLQRVFFALLDLLFLRAWHVRKELKTLLFGLSKKEQIDILDAGTGFGQYAYFMAKTFANAQVLAVDVKRDYLESARRFFEHTTLAGSVELAYEDLTDLKAPGPFDLILSVDVMEHIEDDRAVFNNFNRVLRKGGHVVINTPSDQGGSDVTSDEDTSFIGEHVRDGYGRDEISGKLESVGLRVESVTYTYGTAGSIAWKILVKIPMKMIAISWLLVILVVPYYVLALPFGVVLNAIDTHIPNKRGTGILVLARKPAADNDTESDPEGRVEMGVR